MCDRSINRARRARARAARRRNIASGTRAGTSAHTAAMPSISVAVASAQLVGSNVRTTTSRSGSIPFSHPIAGENQESLPGGRGAGSSTHASGPMSAAICATATRVIPRPGTPTNPSSCPGPHRDSTENNAIESALSDAALPDSAPPDAALLDAAPPDAAPRGGTSADARRLSGARSRAAVRFRSSCRANQCNRTYVRLQNNKVAKPTQRPITGREIVLPTQTGYPTTFLQ